MGKAKLLIVEDEAVSAMSLQLCIEEMGYDACPIASTGDEAIEIAGRDRPDLVLMDINLHGQLNGIDAAKTILTRFRIPSIFVSGYPKEQFEDIDSAHALGYIVKPYNLDDLERVLETSLVKAREASAA